MYIDIHTLGNFYNYSFSMAQGEELKELVELVQGYKYFLGIISGSFSFILLLLLYIWNQMLKGNNKRHEKHESMMEKAMENQATLTNLVTRHDVDIEHLKKV